MRKFKGLIIASLLLAVLCLPAGFALASDITDAVYSGVIEISNSSTAASEVSVNCSIDTQSLIDDWGVDDELTYTAVRNATGADVPYMPGVGENPWCFWVPSINAESYLNYVLYLGTSNLSAKRYYFPGESGMTTADDADLELGDNFTIELSGYIDTTAVSANLVYKEDAVRLYISGTGNITAEIKAEWVDPNGNTANGWSNPTYAYDNDTGTYASKLQSGEGWTAYLQLSITPSINCTDIRYWTGSGASFTQIDADAYYSSAWNDVYQGSFTASTWQIKDLGGEYEVEQMRIRFYKSGAGDATAHINETDFGQADLEVSATDISSGEHKVEIHADTSNLTIEVDDVIKDTVALGDYSVADSSSSWTFCEAAAVPYLEYQKIYVDGVLQQHIAWENDTTFHDLSGNNHDATPTFRTTSSDADVTAELISFQAINLATAPAYSVTGGEPFITENITQSANFTTTVNPTGFPGAAVIEEVSESSGTPSQIPFTIIVGLTAIMFGLGAVYAMGRAGQKSSIVIIAVEIIVMGVGIALRVIDFWMLGLFLIIAIALAMGSRHITWGMPSGGNLIGMLATDFIGLTLINRWIEGSMMVTAETEFINTLMFTKPFILFGVPVPVINIEFFTVGLPGMLKWDYSFFGGNAQILQYFLYSITAVISFMLFCVVIGLLANYFTRVR